MRIVIVGGASSLARTLKPILAEFAEVITAGRRGCDIHLDLAAPVELMALPQGIDAVVNAAARFGGDSFVDMVEAESVNVLGVLKLCHSCSNARVGHLVQISSIFTRLDSTSPFYGVYSSSKRHGDELAQLFSARFGLPLTVLRPSRFYGVGEAGRKHHPLLSAIIDKAEKGEDIFIHGANDALRNFLHVEDLAEIVGRVIQRKIEGTYNCMNVENVRYSEIADAAIEAFGGRSTVSFLKDRPDIPDSVFPRDDTLYRLIDYLPRISISLGMEMEAAHRRMAR